MQTRFNIEPTPSGTGWESDSEGSSHGWTWLETDTETESETDTETETETETENEIYEEDGGSPRTLPRVKRRREVLSEMTYAGGGILVQCGEFTQEEEEEEED